MANLDITRHRAAARFHYTGARMQQGRTLLESDWNEDALLAGEDRRLTLVDLIGAQGSSNSGFNITNVRTVLPIDSIDMTPPHIDFDLQPGSMFVGGLRLVLDPPGESFMGQADWLRHQLEPLPPPPTVGQLAPNLPSPQPLTKILELAPIHRYDLVYLLAWEQPITAVEDSELRERALGGPDSSARIRRMRRVGVAPNVGTDNLEDALAALVAGVNMTLDEQTAELLSNARLTVTPLAPTGELPCGPPPPSGYVGHEDEAIRIELRGPKSITWGFGEAAPLYRVKVGVDGKHITFLNTPPDARRQPKSQQIVEIVPWGAKLPNGEKLAELRGELFRVAESYDPASKVLVLADPVPSGWLQWTNAHQEHWNPKDGDDGGYFYLRMWDRGADTSSPPLIDLGEGPVELGKTGLQISLEGSGEGADYWVIAARRATPDVVVPWQLLTDEAPHGPRRFLAPLGMIRWEAPLQTMSVAEFNQLETWKYHNVRLDNGQEAVWGPVTGVPIDGRRKLQRLCLGGGCTIMVGDGVVSHGLVNSLADAVALLPSAGGRICLMLGQHLIDDLVIEGRKYVEICGVGELSMVLNPSEVPLGPEFTHAGAPMITIRDCENITLRSFTMISDRRIGVKIHGVSSQCKHILLERLFLNQHGHYELYPEQEFGLPQPAVLALGGRNITVRNCTISVDDTLSYTGALVLGGERLRILDNWVLGGDFGSPEVAECMGGIHVLSQSIDVEVAGNVIYGGWGFGIALGHVLAWDSAPDEPQTITLADIWTAAERGLGEPVTHLFDYAPVGGAPVGDPGEDKGWTSAGALVDVRIERNQITGMGLTGISTGMMRLEWTNDAGSRPAFIVIARLSVTNNVVVGNRRASNFSPSDLFAPRGDGCCDLAIGGIVIAAAVDATVAENRVVDNGGDDNWANCGLGFIAMQNLVLRDNHVVDNGVSFTGAVPEGLRGGIAVMEVTGLRGATYKDTIHENVTFEQQPGYTVKLDKLALQVHKNEVAQRAGRALAVHQGFDDLVVTENSLLGKGIISGYGDFLIVFEKDDGVPLLAVGACVEIVGLSLAPDIDWGSLPTQPGIMMVDPGAPATVGGTVEFVANRGELDSYHEGGWAAAYLISAQDSVLMADNLLVANLHAGDGDFDTEFLDDLIENDSDKSFVITNCYVGTIGGALVRGNRFVEDKLGALLSVVIGPTLQASDESAATRVGVVLSSCVGTHCGVIVEPAAGDHVVANNVAIIKRPVEPPASPDCDYSTSFDVDPARHVKITY